MHGGLNWRVLVIKTGKMLRGSEAKVNSPGFPKRPVSRVNSLKR
jgi:hypothetical protein